MCQPSLGRSGITVFACGHPIEEDSRTGRQVEMERRERHDIYILLYIYMMSFLIFFRTRSEISRDYPLNLSISLSGGKETNQDSPSNGE